jgi:hypothetical protein
MRRRDSAMDVKFDKPRARIGHESWAEIAEIIPNQSSDEISPKQSASLHLAGAVCHLPYSEGNICIEAHFVRDLRQGRRPLTGYSNHDDFQMIFSAPCGNNPSEALNAHAPRLIRCR